MPLVVQLLKSVTTVPPEATVIDCDGQFEAWATLASKSRHTPTSQVDMRERARAGAAAWRPPKNNDVM
jgi:hypothetical protein